MLMRPEQYPYEEIKKRILDISGHRDRCCCAMLYGFGQRISELRQLTIDDVMEVEIQGKRCLRIHSVTEKNPTNHERFIAIDMQKEAWLVKIIRDFLQGKRGIIFPYHRATLWRWCYEAVGFNPHGFRKIRLTHLATKQIPQQERAFTDQQLTKFAGWSDGRPAKAYVRLQIEDIIP
jgi:integrase